MSNLSNRFTKAYDVNYPFVSAGMAFIGGSRLAIAVIRAGGIGSIGVGPLSPNKMRVLIREVREEVKGPLNVNFITFMTSEEHIRICIEERVDIVSFHWGHPSKGMIEQIKMAGIKFWQQVGAVEDARIAAGNGADCIIAQGLEAGGHNLSTLPTFVLVPEIVKAVGPVMVLASGGISTGRQVAAALCLGADGVWVGTRLVASDEAYGHHLYKQRLVEAKAADAQLNSTFGPEWPFFNPMRLLENDCVREYRGKEDQVPSSTEDEPIIGVLHYFGKEHRLRQFTNFLPVPGTEADMEWMPLPAGQGVGLIDDVLPAGEIIRTMMEEAVAAVGHFFQRIH